MKIMTTALFASLTALLVATGCGAQDGYDTTSGEDDPGESSLDDAECYIEVVDGEQLMTCTFSDGVQYEGQSEPGVASVSQPLTGCTMTSGCSSMGCWVLYQTAYSSTGRVCSYSWRSFA